jgi:mannosyltransferase OCH1-like enzyme
VSASVLDAVEYAFELALQQQAFLNNSHIPLITHQTWMDMDANAWSDLIRKRVERWLSVAVQPDDERLIGPEMAWFLWDDDGIDALIEKYEPSLYGDFQRLPYPVEKADVFRVVVLKWLGGIVSLIATPLRSTEGCSNSLP